MLFLDLAEISGVDELSASVSFPFSFSFFISLLFVVLLDPSDHGWGNPPSRRKDRRRTPPRDDRKVERQRSPPISRFSDRDANVKKRAASPSKEVQPAKERHLATHGFQEVRKQFSTPTKNTCVNVVSCSGPFLAIFPKN